MTGLWALVLGAGFGVGVVIIITGLRSRPVPLTEITERLDRPGFAPPAEHETGLDGWQLWLSSWATRLTRRPSASPELAAKLRLVDKTESQHTYERMLAALAGATFPILVWLAAVAGGGVRLPVGPVLLLAGGLAAGGWLLPDRALEDAVKQRRRAFRHELSAFLDLVVVILAGGGAIETALKTAADSGDGWAFDRIRYALIRAQSARLPPWESLAELGREIGITELRDLSANIALAGSQGARARDSLRAKADSLRTEIALDVESSASSKTEKMAFPLGILALGMMLFIGYGVVEAISTPSDQFTPTVPVEASP